MRHITISEKKGFGTNHRIVRTKTCVVEINDAIGHTSGYEILFDTGRFVVRRARIVSADKDAIYLSRLVECHTGFDTTDIKHIRFSASAFGACSKKHADTIIRNSRNVIVHLIFGGFDDSPIAANDTYRQNGNYGKEYVEKAFHRDEV